MTKQAPEREAVAIVGIGCRFPGGVKSAGQFWDFLCQRGDAIREVPAERWDADALFSGEVSAPGRTYARRGGFLSDIDQFDPAFFGISPREAAHIDPQQRLLLETAHEAMEDAGERWDDPAVRATGVFVGVFIHDYQHMQFADRDMLGAHTGTGTAMSITANRISYAFDLHGPSMAVDTACSSSLVAVDLACKSLLHAECDYALAGGVNVILKPEMTIAMSKATMLSKDGSCKSFDARADGYVRGEGAGVVVLRRLSDAIAAGNHIYAVIRGSGVNSDGQTKGISVPSGAAQEALTRRVLRESGVDAASVQYVEAHGTGTPVGDPIEANALGRVFSEGRSDGHDKMLIGSVKTNIGHLESASGVAGLIKAALSLEHAEIPPNLHFQHPNQAIDFEALRLEVVASKRSWPETSAPRRAAVNSFGFGGTNAHVLLEQAPASSARGRRQSSLPKLMLPLGAHDPAALRGLAQGYADTLAAGCATEDLIYSVSQRRSHGDFRAALVADDGVDLRAQLEAFAAGESSLSGSLGQRHEGFSGRPVFVYSGMGPQWWAMGRELLEQSEVFRNAVEEVDRKLHPLTGWSVIEQLLTPEEDSQIQRTDVAQPAIFAVQVGLTAIWKAWGVEPAAVLGHSVGEAAALHAAGILSLEDAISAIYHRSRLQHTTAGTGGMLAVGIELEEAQRRIGRDRDSVAIGAVNSVASLTLSGDESVLARLQAELEAEGRFARRLQVEVPYHSPKMDVLRDELVSSLTGLAPQPAAVRYYSTIDGDTEVSALGGAEYWWRNVRQTVLFANATAAAIADGHTCFLELGPHPVLRASIQECLQQANVRGTVTGSLRRGQSDFVSLTTGVAELHVAGARLDWAAIVGEGSLIELPCYAWQRARHWSESEEQEQYRKGLRAPSGLKAGSQRHPLLGAKLDLPNPSWLQTLRLSDASYLRDHRVQGTAVFPGAGYLEMALQTLADESVPGGAQAGPGEYLLLSDVEIGRALYLGDDDEARLETLRDGERWEVHGASGQENAWVRHAAGRCRRETAAEAPLPLDLDGVRERCRLTLPADYAYRLFRDVGLEYGPTFQAIEELWYGPSEALARLSTPAALGEPGSATAAFLFHPAILDACLHALFGALNLNGEDSDRRGNAFLPVSVRQVRVYGRPTAKLWSHARLHTKAAQHFTADVRVYDDRGELVAEVRDLRCQALEHPEVVAQKRNREWMLEYQWEARPRAPSEARPTGRWLVLAPSSRHPLLSALRAQGATCIVCVPGACFSREPGLYSVSPSAASDLEQVVSEVTALGPLTGVVYAWPLLTEEAEQHSEDAGAAWPAQARSAVGLMHVVQALAKLREAESERAASELPTAPLLWILTQGAEAVSAGDRIRVSQSTLWGLRRVVANEHPYLTARIADLDGSSTGYQALSAELQAPLEDDELAFRAGVRFVHRLRRYLPDSAQPSDQPSASAKRMELKVHKSGDLKSIGWVQLPVMELGEQEVEVEVWATALNFKDVMKATGLFPTRLIEGNLWSRDTLGMECSGRISRIGAKVSHLSVGDEVIALAPRTFASHAVTHSALVIPNPGFESASAASIPVAFLTASVALEQLANLQPGERVLVHAASGGVGQAAIQIAHDLGAEVFATAGSPEKRELVRALGVAHVFDSRSLRFAEEIREATGGAGVDVVLNSLAGEAITQSLSVLSDYGRFVELGKMDLDRDFSLRLRPFTRCLSFHAVDLDRMLAQKVETCGRIFRSIYERLVEGRLRPLPVTVHGCDDAASAFQTMASASHTGKLVIDINPSKVSLSGRVGVRFQSDASYLITGGLGGFGRELAYWLAEHGAGHLVLLGRRGAQTPGAAQALEDLRARGASVQIEACDVADADDVARVLRAIPREFPLRGVFHAAAVLDDALIRNLDLARFERTFAAKAQGAWNLHCQTEGLALDQFMCFSSMASVLGNQGSANYCAANAFVDALAHHRRARGLPALTVNWGVIADVGMAADEDFYRQNLERNGLTTIHSRHCLDFLGLLLETERVQTTVCPIDFETWLRFNPAGREGRLHDLLANANTAASAGRSKSAEETALREQLASLDAEARLERVEKTIRTLLAQVFRTDAAKLDSSRSLTALGADSLMAIEIKNRLEAVGLALSVTQILNRNSVVTLSRMLLETLGFGDGSAQDGKAAPASESHSASGSPWFVTQSQRPDAKLRLFCFPYAGGGPSVYHRWPELLPSWIEVVAINLPGRGLRADEPNVSSIAHAADAIAPDMLALLDRPFALFGHCMGAILMYEVAQRLEAQHGKNAEHIFASGCMAPHLYNSPIVHEQEDDAFLDVLRLISFSGTRALIEDPALRGTTFPLLRGDFRAVAEYGSSFQTRAPLRTPITGIAAENDLFAAPKAMEAWGLYTSQGYELFQLPGDHYFVESDRQTVAQLVTQRIAHVSGAPEEAPALDLLSRRPDNGQLGQVPETTRTRFGGSRPASCSSRTRVLCFPPTGIKATELPLPSGVNSDLEYVALEWRGSGTSAAPRSVAEMVDHAYEALRGADVPSIFYGHCLGSVVAYELALRLRDEGKATPDWLVVAGTVGPHLYVAPDAHKLPTDKLLELLSVLKYPLVERLKRDEPFRADRIGLIRADLEAMATYQYQRSEPLETAITAISLRHDLWSYPLRTESWRHHTYGQFEVIEWTGDHYAPMVHAERLHELVLSLGARALAAE